jgi:hypothetical protein
MNPLTPHYGDLRKKFRKRVFSLRFDVGSAMRSLASDVSGKQKQPVNVVIKDRLLINYFRYELYSADC